MSPPEAHPDQGERVSTLEREVELLAANIERERQQKLKAWRRLAAHGCEGPICDNPVCIASGDCGCAAFDEEQQS